VRWPPTRRLVARASYRNLSTMCGLFASFLPADSIAQILHTTNPLPNVASSWNVAPTQSPMVVRRHPETGERHLDLLKWGLLPYWTKDPVKARRPINARSETVASSGMFKGAFAQRRCPVPADVFYEWKVVDDGKQPCAIARQDGQPMAFAGLWEGFKWPSGEVDRTFTIVTTSPNAEMAELHDRMPVILGQADWPTWLGDAEGDYGALLRPARDGTLRTGLISKRVNTPKNNDAALLDPIEQAA
jgi:putative SOS response-associated peptidase YedK